MESKSASILLIHGSGCDGSVWNGVSALLPSRMRALAMDLPGHGNSPPRAGGDTMKVYADAVVEAAEALGPERPAVAGHSLGGAVAITAALEHPELFSRLLLIGTGARLRVVPAVIEALKTDFDEVMRNMRQFSFGPGASPEAIKTAEDMMRRNGRETMLEDFLACDAFDAMARLGEIRIPALAVCGEADMLTPPKYSRFLAERAPNCRLVTIPEAGHMVMLEAPAALAEIIGEFIG